MLVGDERAMVAVAEETLAQLAALQALRAESKRLRERWTGASRHSAHSVERLHGHAAKRTRAGCRGGVLSEVQYSAFSPFAGTEVATPGVPA